jgi:hypothetical protein
MLTVEMVEEDSSVYIYVMTTVPVFTTMATMGVFAR